MSYPAAFDTIGQPFILLTTVDSTNNYAMAQAHAGLATPGTAYFALEQTAGKGQRGKSWKSAPGENIMMSLYLSPGAENLGRTFLLSVAVSLGCYDFYKSLAGDDTSIKWPNDLYWRDRKAGGILIENNVGAPDNSWNFSIAGIGINVNQTDFSGLDGRAVSLKQITGKDFDVPALARRLCGSIGARMESFYKKEFDHLLADYNQVLFKKGHKVRLKKGTAAFETTITGVSETGDLVVYDTSERRFGFGEVSWIFNK